MAYPKPPEPIHTQSIDLVVRQDALIGIYFVMVGSKLI